MKTKTKWKWAWGVIRHTSKRGPNNLNNHEDIVRLVAVMTSCSRKEARDDYVWLLKAERSLRWRLNADSKNRAVYN